MLSIKISQKYRMVSFEDHMKSSKVTLLHHKERGIFIMNETAGRSVDYHHDYHCTLQGTSTIWILVRVCDTVQFLRNQITHFMLTNNNNN